MDINQTFTLKKEITFEQLRHFYTFGFIHFKKVASDEEVLKLISEMNKMEQRFIDEDRKTVLGVPIQWGKTEIGKPFVNRFAYSSEYSEYIKEFVNDERFKGLNF